MRKTLEEYDRPEDAAPERLNVDRAHVDTALALQNIAESLRHIHVDLSSIYKLIYFHEETAILEKKKEL